MKKRIIASLMTVVMLIMAMSTFVCAEEETAAATTYSLTIQNTVGSTALSIEGKTFAVYKLFDVEITNNGVEYIVCDQYDDFYDAEVEIMSVGGFEDTDITSLATIIDTLDPNHLDGVIERLHFYIDGLNTDGDETNNIVADKQYIVNGGEDGFSYNKETNVEFSYTTGYEAGYYLVLDVSDVGTSSVLTTGNLISIPTLSDEGVATTGSTMKIKSSQPTVEKSILENDEELNVTDYQIGDTVTYQITATFPTDTDGYNNVIGDGGNSWYSYTLYDTLSDGLEIDWDSVEVLFSNIESDGEFEKLNEENFFGNSNSSDEGDFGGFAYKVGTPNENFPGEYTFRWGITGWMAEFISAGYTGIQITYNATVTEDAVVYDTDIDEYGNETNKAEIVFSNNPYDSTSTGRDEDTVYSYTFDIDILKTGDDGYTALEGAAFGLWKAEEYDSTKTMRENESTRIAVIYDEEVYTVVGTVVEEGSGATKAIVSPADGVIDIDGLDAGTYVLVEEYAPTGYNLADPIEFKIIAEYDENYVPTLSYIVDGEANNGQFTVVNTSLTLLPETGGMGTTIFMIGGGILMFAAVVLLITKRRKANKAN